MDDDLDSEIEAIRGGVKGRENVENDMPELIRNLEKEKPQSPLESLTRRRSVRGSNLSISIPSSMTDELDDAPGNSTNLALGDMKRIFKAQSKSARISLNIKLSKDDVLLKDINDMFDYIEVESLRNSEFDCKDISENLGYLASAESSIRVKGARNILCWSLHNECNSNEEYVSDLKSKCKVLLDNKAIDVVYNATQNLYSCLIKPLIAKDERATSHIFELECYLSIFYLIYVLTETELHNDYVALLFKIVSDFPTGGGEQQLPISKILLCLSKLLALPEEKRIHLKKELREAANLPSFNFEDDKVPKTTPDQFDKHVKNVEAKYPYFFYSDRSSLEYLPYAVKEGLLTMERYVYKGYGTHQKESKTKQSSEHPFIIKLDSLFTQIQDNLWSSVVLMLKILLSVSPGKQASSPTINIYYRAYEKNDLTMTEIALNTLNVTRTKGILANSISSLLLNLLKSFKLCHIYKYECISRYIYDANGMLLLLKLLNGEFEQDLKVNDEIEALTAVQRFRKEKMAAVDIENCLSQKISSKEDVNLNTYFSQVNFLKIMQKITKGKLYRIYNLIQFKSFVRI
jgi:hypothetical protein